MLGHGIPLSPSSEEFHRFSEALHRGCLTVRREMDRSRPDSGRKLDPGRGLIPADPEGTTTVSDTTDYLTDAGQAAEPAESAAPAAETRSCSSG